MSTLSEFLLARITEDEVVARGAVRWSEGASQWADAGEPDWQHIARWDPARVLTECEAKRAIVAEHEMVAADTGDGQGCGICGIGYFSWGPEQMGDGPCATLRALALPYAMHEDYRKEWRP